MSAGLAHALSTNSGTARSASDGDGLPGSSLMQAVIDLSLRDQAGVEGGFWHPQRDVVAYAFPPMTAAASSAIRPARKWNASSRPPSAPSMAPPPSPTCAPACARRWCSPPARYRRQGGAGGLDAQARAGDERERAQPVAGGHRPVAGFRHHQRRLAGGTLTRWRGQSERLASQLAHAERLATLGRVAAGMAHEIRNPIGAMRMKAENALAAPAQVRETRVTGALEMVVSQTERLDALVASLLAAQPFQVQRECVDLASWIEARCQAHAELAERQQVQLASAIDIASFGGSLTTSALDPVQMARAWTTCCSMHWPIARPAATSRSAQGGAGRTAAAVGGR
jgi:hypothetical protein